MVQFKKVPPLVRVMTRYGFISGIIGIIALIVFFYIGKHPFWIFPLFDPRVLLIAIFLVFGLKEVRDYFQEGVLFFWQGLFGSLVLLAVMSVTGYAGVTIFGLSEPEFVKMYINQGLQQINNIPPDSADEIGKSAIEEVRKTIHDTTVSWMAKRYAVQTYLFGFFIAVIISVVLRKQTKSDS
jgi:hypothetical protein